MDGGVERREGAERQGQAVKSRVNCSPSSCIKFKGGWCTKLPLINCKQKGVEEGMGVGGEQGSGLAYMISTLGQMMSSIRMDTAIFHLFPHQSNLSVLTRGWDVCFCMCECACACFLQTERHRQSPDLTWRALSGINKVQQSAPLLFYP